MIDEKRLDNLELDLTKTILCGQHVYAPSEFTHQELLRLIRLARLGLWARDVGVPAMKLSASSTQFREGEYGYQFILLAYHAPADQPKDTQK